MLFHNSYRIAIYGNLEIRCVYPGAWSASHQLVLGQKKVNSKSNELTAIPALLEMLEIEVNIISIDALGCQKEIASLIIKKKED
jgi:hypothetical protein